jgi:hypothetical protein
VRIGLRSHLTAGALAVTGITILSAGYLFPLVLRGAGKGSTDGVISIAMVVVISVSLAVAVWLLVYVPLSILVDKMASTTLGRVKLSAAFSTLVLSGVSVVLVGRSGGPMLALLLVSIVLGLGGALYTFFRAGIARELSARSDLAS